MHIPRSSRETQAANQPRVGFFGILGSGNLGNDGSLDAVVAFLRDQHPDVQLGFMCMGPDQVAARYGAPATHLQWYEPHAGSATGARAILLKIVGKLLDPFRTLAWVRRYDVVIVPGMGILEATLPLRPWAMPYSLLCLGTTARFVGTKVAMVSVGANVIQKRATRWVVTRAARLAHYRSYRDAQSRNAMRAMGVDVTADEVYPDLAFALPTPDAPPAPTGVVGVGLMAYYGGNDDRHRADEFHRAYVETMKRFVRRLLDDGRQIRLFIGDPVDERVLKEVLTDLRASRPDLDPSRVVAEPAPTLQDLMRQMATVDTVVATRFHNVVSALKLSKPTVSIGYAAKFDAVMESMGLAEFCMSARSVDFEHLIERFAALEGRREQLAARMVEQNQTNLRHLERQFAALSRAVRDAAANRPVPATSGEAP